MSASNYLESDICFLIREANLGHCVNCKKLTTNNVIQLKEDLSQVIA